MATASEIQTRIEELNEAIADPARQVTLGSQNITLRSIDDLIKARNDLQTQLDSVNNATTPTRRQYYAVYAGRGLD